MNTRPFELLQEMHLGSERNKSVDFKNLVLDSNIEVLHNVEYGSGNFFQEILLNHNNIKSFMKYKSKYGVGTFIGYNPNTNAYMFLFDNKMNNGMLGVNNSLISDFTPYELDADCEKKWLSKIEKKTLNRWFININNREILVFFLEDVKLTSFSLYKNIKNNSISMFVGVTRDDMAVFCDKEGQFFINKSLQALIAEEDFEKISDVDHQLEIKVIEQFKLKLNGKYLPLSSLSFFLDLQAGLDLENAIQNFSNKPSSSEDLSKSLQLLFGIKAETNRAAAFTMLEKMDPPNLSHSIIKDLALTLCYMKGYYSNVDLRKARLAFQTAYSQRQVNTVSGGKYIKLSQVLSAAILKEIDALFSLNQNLSERDKAQFYYLKGVLLEEQKNRKEAYELYFQSYTLGVWEAGFNLANAYVNGHLDDRGTTNFDKALEIYTRMMDSDVPIQDSQKALKQVNFHANKVPAYVSNLEECLGKFVNNHILNTASANVLIKYITSGRIKIGDDEYALPHTVLALINNKLSETTLDPTDRTALFEAQKTRGRYLDALQTISNQLSGNLKQIIEVALKLSTKNHDELEKTFKNCEHLIAGTNPLDLLDIALLLKNTFIEKTNYSDAKESNLISLRNDFLTRIQKHLLLIIPIDVESYPLQRIVGKIIEISKDNKDNFFQMEFLRPLAFLSHIAKLKELEQYLQKMVSDKSNKKETQEKLKNKAADDLDELYHNKYKIFTTENSKNILRTSKDYFEKIQNLAKKNNIDAQFTFLEYYFLTNKSSNSRDLTKILASAAEVKKENLLIWCLSATLPRYHGYYHQAAITLLEKEENQLRQANKPLSFQEITLSKNLLILDRYFILKNAGSKLAPESKPNVEFGNNLESLKLMLTNHSFQELTLKDIRLNAYRIYEGLPAELKWAYQEIEAYSPDTIYRSINDHQNEVETLVDTTPTAPMVTDVFISEKEEFISTETEPTLPQSRVAQLEEENEKLKLTIEQMEQQLKEQSKIQDEVTKLKTEVSMFKMAFDPKPVVTAQRAVRGFFARKNLAQLKKVKNISEVIAELSLKKKFKTVAELSILVDQGKIKEAEELIAALDKPQNDLKK